MSAENVELARRGYDALTREGVNGILGFLDPEIEIVEAEGIPGARTYRGHAGLAEAFAVVDEAFDELRFEPEEIVDVDDRVVVVVRMAGRGKGSQAEVSAVVAHVWTVREGKGVRMDMFGSREEALAATGLAGA
jgi:ketosteroid isomerase-like protein